MPKAALLPRQKMKCPNDEKMAKMITGLEITSLSKAIQNTGAK